MNITTLTLNPAYDVHVSIADFKLWHENLSESVTRDIGGKGINISRALSANAVKNRALVVLGADNAADFRNSLAHMKDISNEYFDYSEISVRGQIRENITIHHQNGGETRLSFKGFECQPVLLDEVAALIAPTPGDIVTFTGSLPVGIDTDAAERFLIKLKNAGVHVVIDSKSISLDAIGRIKPWLIKPNSEEIAHYLGREMDDCELINAARSLHDGGVENVIISLGGDGAIFASNAGVYRLHVPKIDAISTIGAGDSSIAGFIHAFIRNADALDCIRTALSYGTATCLRDGTNPPLPADIERIYNDITISKVEKPNA
ncbi:MAG: 1-phosphofructokinase family hexose kinase [Clostridiales bacterium]|nr:1-phosphofructokinase family hexose kinase [Clostridiales bacterium]